MSDDQHLPSTTTNGNLPAAPRPSMPAEFDEEAAVSPTAMLKRYAAALLRYKWLILLLVVVGTSAAAWASRYVPLRYQAEATIWIEVVDRSATAPIQTQGALPSGAWIELLRSYHVMDHVAREERLYLEYAPRDSVLMREFRVDTSFYAGKYRLRIAGDGRSAELQTEAGQRIEQVRAGDPIGASLGFLWQPPASAYTPKRTVNFTVLTPRDAARQVSRRLVTGLPRGGNVLTLRYSGSDAGQVARVVNAVADRFIGTAVDFKASRQGILSEALETQLRTAEDNVTRAELALENFQIETATLPSQAAMDPSTPLTQAPTVAMSTYMTHTVQRDNAQRDLESIRRVLGLAAEEPLSVDALTTIPSVGRSPELTMALNELTAKRASRRALLQQYTTEHNVVIRATADLDTLEKRTIPELAHRLAAELEGEVARLDGMIAGTAQELRAIPSRVLEEARLRRSVAHAVRLYDDLRARHETALLAREATMPDVRILDRAYPPQKPSLDPRLKMIAMGFLGSIALGLVLALFLDRVDPRLRYAEQVSHDMGLGIVGAVPNLAKNGRRALHAGKGAEVVEALRGIRLNLIHAYGSAGPIALTVTSPGSGDGKTFITSNLALAFADLGYRTLVIDGDTRRGTLHHIFAMDRRPGLTDYLAGKAQLTDIVRATQFPLVSVIPGGRRLSNGPELLSSQRMGDLIARARADYQVVLVDSPPLGAGVDPLVLATLSGHVLLVMRTGVTSRTIADAKLAMLDRLPVRVLGAVLNGFDSQDSYRYYSYLPGYEAGGDESAEENDRALQPA